MAKHRRIWNASVYEKYMHEGRGCGYGSGYAPWIRVQDFASRGVASRVKSRTTGRVHHLMSNHELAYFYILDWSDSVIDIREQFPLTDLELAVSIATQAGIKYPKDNVSGYPYVLTCDFMITTTEGYRARTVKMTSELESIRTREKLEIERRYWGIQGIELKVVTEREISYQKAKNIAWIYTADGFGLTNDDSSKLLQAQDLILSMLLSCKCSVLEAAKIAEHEYSFDAGVGLQLFKQLVLNKIIAINLDEPLDLNARGVVA